MVGITSWNIRGMGDPIKRATVLSELELLGADLVCLQETHLTNESKSLIWNKKFQVQFHSVHTSYSRGVCILVKKGMVFSCKDVRIDLLGCYVFLFCTIEGKSFVIANVYIPPPFKMGILYHLLEYVEDKGDIPLIAVGDFNMVLNGKMDRFPPRAREDRATEGRFTQLLEEIGWCDLWRIRNQEERQYSCFSESHRTLSRIDMAVGNRGVLPLLGKIEYRPRGLSDHSPLTRTINICNRRNERVWALNSIWLEIIGKKEEISEKK